MILKLRNFNKSLHLAKYFLILFMIFITLSSWWLIIQQTDEDKLMLQYQANVESQSGSIPKASFFSCKDIYRSSNSTTLSFGWCLNSVVSFDLWLSHLNCWSLGFLWMRRELTPALQCLANPCSQHIDQNKSCGPAWIQEDEIWGAHGIFGLQYYLCCKSEFQIWVLKLEGTWENIFLILSVRKLKLQWSNH